jgi:hypothetical protein
MIFKLHVIGREVDDFEIEERIWNLSDWMRGGKSRDETFDSFDPFSRDRGIQTGKFKSHFLQRWIYKPIQIERNT